MAGYFTFTRVGEPNRSLRATRPGMRIRGRDVALPAPRRPRRTDPKDCRVLEDPCGQSRRDRDPGVPRRVRARGAHRRRVPVRGPELDAPAEGRRGLPDRREGASGPRLPRCGRDHPGRPRVRCRRDLPRLRVPLREPRARSSGGRRRHRVHRSSGPGPRDGGQQGHGEGARAGRRRAGAALHPGVARSRRAARGRRGDRLPDLREGGRRRRRSRHAARRRSGGPPRGPRGRHAGGRQRVRRSDDVPRAGGRPAPAHRGADPRRCRRRDGPPVRARLLRAAPAPEGRRDRARAEPRRDDPAGDAPRRHRLRPLDRVRQRGHGGVPPGHRGGASTCSSR